jgi:hypothetical protein
MSSFLEVAGCALRVIDHGLHCDDHAFDRLAACTGTAGERPDLVAQKQAIERRRSIRTPKRPFDVIPLA